MITSTNKFMVIFRNLKCPEKGWQSIGSRLGVGENIAYTFIEIFISTPKSNWRNYEMEVVTLEQGHALLANNINVGIDPDRFLPLFPENYL